jgi:exosome complex component RRP40
VIQKLGDAFKVDIGTAHAAVLSLTAFEGASKRNRPNINVSGYIYLCISIQKSHKNILFTIKFHSILGG